jgi:hypothetical protein
MADEQTPPAPAAAAPAAPAAIPDDVIAKIAEQATKQLSGQMSNLAVQSSKSAVDDMISRLTGKQEHDNLETQVLERFVNQPTQVLARAVEKAKEMALEEFRAERDKEKQELSQQAERDKEFRAAAKEVFEKRPDIQKNEAIREIVDRYYVDTDPTLPEAERLEIAVKKADKALEKIDGKKSEERIQAAMSITSSSSAPVAATPDPEVLLQDAGKNYCTSREEEYRKKFGALPARG